MDNKDKLQVKAHLLRKLMSELDQNSVKRLAPSRDTSAMKEVSVKPNKQNMSQLYVEAVEKQFNIKPSVKAATNNNIVLAGEQKVDDTIVTQGDRVLVKDQDKPNQNGIYVVSKDNWSRALDAKTTDTIGNNMFTFVEQGTVNGGEGYATVIPSIFEMNKTPMIWAPFNEKKDNAGNLRKGGGAMLSSTSPTSLDADLLTGVGDMGAY